MIKNVTKKLVFGIPAVVVMGLLVYGFSRAWICKGIESSDAAGWMQAIGSVAAICGAAWGIRAQINQIETKATKDRQDELINLCQSLIAEIDAYRTATAKISEIINGLDVQGNRILRYVFPTFRPSFPIFKALAGRIGLIEDAKLRAKLVGVFADIETFFSLINHNSELAAQIPHDDFPSGNLRSALSKIFPVIERSLENLVASLDLVRRELDAAVAARAVGISNSA